MLIGADDPASTWQHAERYLGDGTRTYSPYSADLDISPEFHPVYGAESFIVPTFWLEAGAGQWLANSIPSPVADFYRDRGRDAVLLPVHPETLRLPGLHRREVLAAAAPGPPLRVVPSANARTVFVERLDGQPVPPHFLKLHYPKRLSRFTRRLRYPVIGLQLWVADELSRIGAPFLPEVAGGVVGDDPLEAWGFLLREPQPRVGPDLPYTVPLFALYGRDIRNPDHPTLLEQLIAGSGEHVEQWVCRRLIEPMVSLWCDVLLRTGCAVELHGQNTLLRFSLDPPRTRVAVRDCAIYVDPGLRADRGLVGLPPRNVISQDVDKPREQVLSLVYDCFLGSHTLAYVAALMQRRFGVEPAVLQRYARKVLAGWPGVAELLPPTVYYYADRLPEDGRWELVDTGSPPRWR